VRRCLNCDKFFDDPSWDCPQCGAQPVQHADYVSFVPEIPSDGMVPENFAWLASVEEGFWWFEARNRLIEWAVERWCNGARSFFEVGCGTGFVISRIARRFPHLRLAGAEYFPQGLPFVRSRLPQTALYQMDARRIPFSNEFDVAGAFDVIEHIDDDETVLRELRRALTPGGILLLTVPQHRLLWSRVDEYSHHKRRYSRTELRAKLQAAGYEVLALRSFVSLLLPLQLAERLKKSKATFDYADAQAEFEISSLLSNLLGAIMRLEFELIRAGVSFPVGGSLLAVCRRRES
jgi:SAM-dependent methyltransferase